MLENNEISPVWLQNPKIFILFMTFESLNYSVMQLVIYLCGLLYPWLHLCAKLHPSETWSRWIHVSCYVFMYTRRSLFSLSSPHYGCPRAGVGSNSPHLSASSGHSHGMVNGQKSLELCSHSPDGRQPSPLTSPLLNDACSVRTDDEDEVRRKVCDLMGELLWIENDNNNHSDELLCCISLSGSKLVL